MYAHVIFIGLECYAAYPGATFERHYAYLYSDMYFIQASTARNTASTIAGARRLCLHPGQVSIACRRPGPCARIVRRHSRRIRGAACFCQTSDMPMRLRFGLRAADERLSQRRNPRYATCTAARATGCVEVACVRHFRTGGAISAFARANRPVCVGLQETPPHGRPTSARGSRPRRHQNRCRRSNPRAAPCTACDSDFSKLLLRLRARARHLNATPK